MLIIWYFIINFSEIVDNPAVEEQDALQAEVIVVPGSQFNISDVMTDNSTCILGTRHDQGSAPAVGEKRVCDESGVSCGGETGIGFEHV